jgi:hypothetical protein
VRLREEQEVKSKPKLTIVPAQPAPEEPLSLETTLRKLLRQERSLELRLIKTRAQIGAQKRAYQEKHKTFGMSNEALLKALTHKD